jgi:hypothetical protein
VRLAEAHKRLGEALMENELLKGALPEAGHPFAPGDVEEMSGLTSPKTGKSYGSRISM